MIWSKCGKIILESEESGKVLDCDTNPCGWYTVLGLRYWELDEDNLPYDECRCEEETVLAIVRNGIFCWRDEKLTPCQKPQYCGRHKGKNYIIDVFNLTGCQDSVPAFKDELFKFSDEYNEDEWKVFEDNGEISREAGSAVENEWFDEFQRLYGINFDVEIQILSQFWFQDAKAWLYETEEYTECWCENWDEIWNEETWEVVGCEDGSEPICDTYIEYGDILATGGDCWRWGPNAEDLDYLFERTGGNYGINPDICGGDWPCYWETCADWVGTVESIPVTNLHILESLKDRSKYFLINSHGSHNNGGSRKINRTFDRGTLCYSYSYVSSPGEIGYSDASTQGNQHYRFLCQDIYVHKNAKTPEKAIGVKLELKRKNIKRNTINNNYIDTVKDIDAAITIYFDEKDGKNKYEVEPHTHVNLLSVIEAPSCNDEGIPEGDGYYAPWAPFDQYDFKTEIDEDRIAFIEYIWKEEDKK